MTLVRYLLLRSNGDAVDNALPVADISCFCFVAVSRWAGRSAGVARFNSVPSSRAASQSPAPLSPRYVQARD